MNEMPSEDLSPAERRALTALPRERPPRPELEEQVVAALAARGLLQRRRPGGLGRWLAAAAGAAAVFALAFWLGRRSAPQPEPELQAAAPRFLLLLYDIPGPPPPDMTPEDFAAAVREYSSWAARAGVERVVGGEALTPRGERLRMVDGRIERKIVPQADDELYVGGFFALGVATFEEAAALADTCPHLKYGGTVEIRAVRDLSQYEEKQ